MIPTKLPSWIGKQGMLFVLGVLISSIVSWNDPVLFVIIFLACWLIMAGSIIFSFLEGIATWRLSSWVYHLGPVAKVIEEEVECPPGLSVLAEVKSDLVTFRVTEGLRCVFRRSWQLFRSRVHTFFELKFRVHTLFEIKGTLSWSAGKLKIVGRYPLSSALGSLAWVEGWTVSGVFVWSQGHLLGLLLVGFGWLFGSILWFPSRYLELKRFTTLTAELRSLLEGNESSSRVSPFPGTGAAMGA